MAAKLKLHFWLYVKAQSRRRRVFDLHKYSSLHCTFHARELYSNGPKHNARQNQQQQQLLSITVCGKMKPNTNNEKNFARHDSSEFMVQRLASRSMLSDAARPTDCARLRRITIGSSTPCECLIDDCIKYTLNNNLQRRYRTRFLPSPTVERRGDYRLEKPYACVENVYYIGERLRFR